VSARSPVVPVPWCLHTDWPLRWTSLLFLCTGVCQRCRKIQKQLFNADRVDTANHVRIFVMEPRRRERMNSVPCLGHLAWQVSLRNFVSVATVWALRGRHRRTMILFYNVVDSPCINGAQHLVASIQYEVAHGPCGQFAALPSQCPASVLDERRPCVPIHSTRPDLRMLDGLTRPPFNSQ